MYFGFQTWGREAGRSMTAFAPVFSPINRTGSYRSPTLDYWTKLSFML